MVVTNERKWGGEKKRREGENERIVKGVEGVCIVILFVF